MDGRRAGSCVMLGSVPSCPSFLVSPLVKLSVAGRGGARKGGSCVLIPDLVVMEKVGASGRIIIDVSSGQAYLLGWVVLLTFISLMGSFVVIANQVALFLKWKKPSWMVMVRPTDRLDTGRNRRNWDEKVHVRSLDALVVWPQCCKKRMLHHQRASSSYNTGAKPPTRPKTLHEPSHPNSFGFLNHIAFSTEQTRRIIDSCDIWLIQNTYTFQGLKNKEPLRHIRHYLSIVDNIQAGGATKDTSSSLIEEEEWNRIDEYVQYQDDLWDEPSPSMKDNPSEQVCLSGGDIYNDPSFIRFYQNDNTSQWGNCKRKEKGEDGPEWIIKIDHDGEWTEEEERDDPNKVFAVSFYPRTEPVEPLKWKALENRLKPPSVEPPKLELKELPEHLELLEVLWNHKGAIAWSIKDIKGIDSYFYTHKILMEDEFKPSVQPQRPVNPNIKEVVKKEVIELLDAGLIYPISDSPWVSPVQVVLNKGGMTVVKNEKDELIPQ
nr:reverse transcriptase domain-containing protein [Tanacetum cinerariifolium]